MMQTTIRLLIETGAFFEKLIQRIDAYLAVSANRRRLGSQCPPMVSSTDHTFPLMSVPSSFDASFFSTPPFANLLWSLQTNQAPCSSYHNHNEHTRVFKPCPR